jgi:hypothetical protein
MAMINPVIILHTDSTATQQINLYPVTRQCMIFWNSGHYSSHKVRRRNMLRLLVDLKQSAGVWVNRYVLDSDLATDFETVPSEATGWN